MAATIGDETFIQRVTTDAGPGLEPRALALAGHGEAYNEEAFHHFLAIERKRSEASTRPFLLLLVEFERQTGGPIQIDAAMASRVFGALTGCLRETDVIGWYRDDRIAGAVLTDLGDAPQPVVPKQVTDRVTHVLRNGLTGQARPVVRVRIYHLPTRAKTLDGTSRGQGSEE